MHATLQPALSVGRSVGRLVGHTLLFYHFIFLTLLLLPKWSGDLKYGPCPPTRDFGSHVSGLVHLEMTFLLSLGRIIKNYVTLDFERRFLPRKNALLQGYQRSSLKIHEKNESEDHDILICGAIEVGRIFLSGIFLRKVFRPPEDPSRSY